MFDVASWHPALQALLRVLLFVLPLLLVVPGLIWWERRLLSWMQDRIGPNRVATITLKSGRKIKLFGLLQPIADGIKLFFKEDITPSAIDRLIYFVAPAVALFPAFALGGTLPWSGNTLLTPIADVNVGILYVMAISSLGVYGIVLAGYASNNKYSLMGGLRATAQLISYELAMGMSLAAIVLASGSLKMTQMVTTQQGDLLGVVPFLNNWFIFTPFGFVAAVVFAICVIAETNRAPFDLPEAENELIAGYHTEYSSMKFAVFFMGEYAAMLVFAGVFSTVFLGGYDMFIDPLEGIAGTTLGGLATFMFKTVASFTCFIWLRASLPRLRYDQLMSLGWRTLLPVAVSNFIVVALWILITNKYGVWQGWIAYLGSFGLLFAVYLAVRGLSKNRVDNALAPRSISLVDGTRSVNVADPQAEGVGS
ncbi:MAG: NADH-quinone oxidoreductase subunit H [Methanoregulaceae archaeon]|nr:NADH-quinone oxidoreductase subunit H [Methanoregulaceae archaeon]